MTNFNYEMPGEFYSRKRQGMRPSGLAYHRFDTVAEAIRFAIEDLPSAALAGCMLETDGQRFGASELRELYASPRYPLRRPTRERTGKATVRLKSAQRQ
jgi:hypothetical protein